MGMFDSKNCKLQKVEMEIIKKSNNKKKCKKLKIKKINKKIWKIKNNGGKIQRPGGTPELGYWNSG